MLNIKTISRIAAIQILYQYNFSNNTEDVELLTQNMLKLYKDNAIYSEHENNLNQKIKPSIGYLKELTKCAIDNLITIDGIIGTNLDIDKKIDDIMPLMLAILRIAVCELEFFKYIPRKVVINEFTNITSQMLSEAETGFVNFILDKIAKDEKNI